ncbi:uncharacterized protein AC631_02067 [Debaryomyces fabryi]|uniref:RanBD1 domain-containing protein n=1 Tax=Debaryomyces fabryi TaxID=58627 RepID=A0A0V1Q1S6_9ASCO|nr:uncharacterized protein AC631_02067 [Debaryomyces fabryi]KSA02159.1 hypothetical protein AC631_02067 [Debaryomyces fabryi]CUM45460.1 unnamed protein product [Debaryomyces fabryi]
MSNDTSNKRKLEEEYFSDNKKVRQESPDSVVDDLNYLKESIKQEIFKTFEERFNKLENEIKQLKHTSKDNSSTKSGSGKKEESVSTPPDETNLKVSSGGSKLHPLNPTATELPKSNSNPFDEIKGFKSVEGNEKASDLKPSKHTFGGSSFKLTTPMNSFVSNSNPADTPTAPNTAQSSPKHVFGATSSFGNVSAFDVAKSKKNVFEALPSKSTTENSKSPSADISKSTSSSVTSSFGSGAFGNNTKFNNAFQNSLKKKSFLDDKESKDDADEETRNSETNGKEKTPTTQQYKQVNLTPVEEIKTGEENEKSHFTSMAKIFELDLTNISEGWKERGLGRLHLNQSLEDPLKVRLVMRSQGLLRVVLNMKVTSDTKLIKGLEASLSPGKFVRWNSINEHGVPVQYLLKFANQTIRDELVEKVENLKETFETEPKSKGTETSTSVESKETKQDATGVKWL